MNQVGLQGFVKIVELGSFSDAAEALFLSQSALSQQIRTLEGQLKFDLFQHVPRRVILTPAGREFYPRAKQIVELYELAVKDARAVQLNVNPPKRHLQLGYQNVALEMFGYDLFAFTEELCLRYAPLMSRCNNRKDIWKSILSGSIDLSFQIECAEIAAWDLEFTPLLYIPEIGVPFHTSEQIARGWISLEQAMEYRWIFAGPTDQSLYEMSMTREAARNRTDIIISQQVKSVQYELPTLMLVPSVYYRRPDPKQVFLIDWKKGMRFGVVTKKEKDPEVVQYVEELRCAVPKLSQKLFGLALESAVE